MKRLALLALLIIGSAATLSAANQATIRASNYGATGGAIYYLATGGALLSGDYKVEMFGGASAGSLASIASGVISTDSGYFDFGFVAIPGVEAGADAFFQVKAWKGASFDAASENGISAVWSQKTASWNGDPMTPMQGDDGNMPTFAVTPVVPEPSTIALGLLGVAALLIRRRK